MRSGQLAQRTGVSTDTLRHYERLGLLARPLRTSGNYRNYSQTAEARVALIQRALRIGFSLLELKTVLVARDRGEAPCRRVRALLDSRIAALNLQILDFRRLRRDLNRLAKDWDTRLRTTRKGERAHLLESMPHEFKNGYSRKTLRNRKGR
jgi:DNA-binding transcriptional MerR regulator